MYLRPMKLLALSISVAILGCSQTETPEPDADESASALPNFDILLGSMANVDGQLQVSSLKLVADYQGYDNQPHFTSDGRSLLYTSQRNGQTDIYRYDLNEKTTTPMAVTPEGEYSATSMPNGNGYSVIRQDADSLQRIWAFDADGSNARVILEEIHPVGYHAWGDEHTIAMFVLGDPVTLQVADTQTGMVETIETNIGRSLHRIPGKHAVSFVHKETEDRWVIKALDLETNTINVLTETRPGAEDYAWTPDGKIVMGEGASLYAWSAEMGWSELADLSVGGVNQITRLDIDASGSQIALVIQ